MLLMFSSHLARNSVWGGTVYGMLEVECALPQASYDKYAEVTMSLWGGGLAVTVQELLCGGRFWWGQ